MTLPKYGFSNYKKKTRKKRPGRHAKNVNKRVSKRKRKNRGQGR